jgi:HD-like signal output (HDOD) protein
MKTPTEQFLLAIARIEKFSPAPLILARAMKLLRDPQSDIADIAALVARDPSLTANLIRWANSAFYGTGLPAQTIDEAVSKIGFRETIHLLNLTVARVVAGRDLGSYGISAEDFWAESLFNGLFLRNLAAETGCADPDEAYTVGLLRFIGRLAINQAIHDLGGGLFWFGDDSIAHWEEESVGFRQSHAGAILLAKWHFSENMIQAIAGQDAPAVRPEPNWLAEALYFASALLPQGLGASFHSVLTEGAAPLPVGSDFMHHYGLTQAAVDTLLASTRQDYDRIRENFGR